MRRILAAVIVCYLSSPVTGEDRIRIATFNINWGNVNLPDIHRTIKQADADIVCIQESNRVSEQFLRRQFHTLYPHVLFVGHKGQYAAERFGFLSKLALNDVRFEPPFGGLFGTYFATVTVGKRDVRIANVHLSPFTIRRGSSVLQAIRAIGAVEEIHQKEIATIAQSIQIDCPTLVCGDFNSLSTFAAPKRLMDLGMTDSFASCTQIPDTHPTWRWPVGRSQVQFRIDYVFHSPHFETLTSAVLKTEGSDHFCVVSELKFLPQILPMQGNN